MARTYARKGIREIGGAVEPHKLQSQRVVRSRRRSRDAIRHRYNQTPRLILLVGYSAHGIQHNREFKIAVLFATGRQGSRLEVT